MVTKERYEGVCLDGPLQGKILDCKWTRFTVSKPVEESPRFRTFSSQIIGAYQWNDLTHKWEWQPP